MSESHDVPPQPNVSTLLSDQIELYTAYRIAAEEAQGLEVEAGNVALFFVAFLVGTDQIDDHKRALFSSLERDVNRRTLGNLLRQLRGLISFDETIIRIIDEALEKRNYLTHHFFRVHNFAIFSEDGRGEMTKELKEIQRTFGMARSYLSAISSLLGKHAGIQEAEIEQLVERGKSVRI
jgi:hypothetical protein